MAIGRPTKLTPEVTEKICAGIRSGLYLEDAASLAGVDVRSVHRWMARGDDEPDGQHAAFCHAIKKAVSETQVAALGIIRTAAEGGNWTAAAWYLERRHPNLWGRRAVASQAAHEGQEAQEQTALDADVVMRKLEALRASQEGSA